MGQIYFKLGGPCHLLDEKVLSKQRVEGRLSNGGNNWQKGL